MSDLVAFAVGLGREAAESHLMTDHVTIRTPGTPGAWDEATGTYADGPGAVLYAGPARVRRPNVAEREASAGDAAFVLSGAIVSIPVGVGTDMPPMAVVTVDYCAFDPDLTGRVLHVSAGHAQSHGTARRFPCIEVSR